MKCQSVVLCSTNEAFITGCKGGEHFNIKFSLCILSNVVHNKTKVNKLKDGAVY